MRICVFSERLRRPYDEGIRNVAMHLIQALAGEHDVLALTSNGDTDAEYGIQNIDTNRLLLSSRLSRRIRQFRPQAIVYIPTACATVFSFLRARVLRHYAGSRADASGAGGRSCIALITLQPRKYTTVGRTLIGRLAPDWVLAQSARTSDTLRDLGCRTALLPPAVDTRRFCPASSADKSALRAKYGIPAAAQVATHIGHLKAKRNLTSFQYLQATPGYHTVVVASTSTLQDQELKRDLSAAGVTVIDTYVAHIEEIYHLSDAYLFLAEEQTAAIELPLSVLEAMACNLPVICTPFGGLPDFFPAGRGLYYWQGEAELHGLLERALSAPCSTRTLVEPLTWTASAQGLVHVLQTPEIVR